MYDFCVVGGGIVGLATAMELLQRHPGASLLLLEKEEELATHQTGHNSGVIHSGIYYPSGSLKARFSKQGEAMTKKFCMEHQLEFRACGKLLVATSETERPRMEALHQRAALHGIPVERLDGHELSELEPNIHGVGALLVPNTAIVDYGEVSRTMAGLVTGSGGEIKVGEQVTYIRESPGSVALRTARGLAVACRKLVVCAGLQADRLAHLAGIKTETRIIPFRGEYYQLPERLNGFVDHLIYPIPDPSLPFLGVHLTPTLQGAITLGPNAVLGMAREGYSKMSLSLRDVADYLGFPGFWIMAGNNARVGVKELKNSLFLRGYLNECRRFAPALQARDLLPREAGIRAQAVSRSGALIHDFELIQTGRMLHVINAPSPAATAAMPIALELTSRLSRAE